MIDPDMKNVADEIEKDPGWIANGDKKNDLPEAPASATIRVWIDDFGVLLTMRSDRVGEVVKQIDWIVDYAKRKGWKPVWAEKEKENGSPQKTKPCENCGGTRVLRIGVKNGKKWAGWLCDNRESNCPPEWVNLASK